MALDPAFIQKFEGHFQAVKSVVISSNGHYMASGSDDTTIRIWDPVDGKCLRVLEGHGYAVNSVAFSPFSDKVASVSNDETVKIWDVKTGNCLQTLQLSCEGYSVAFSSNATYLASAMKSSIMVWSLTNDTYTFLRSLEGHNGPIYCVAFFTDDPESGLASGSDDKTIRIWDVAENTCHYILKGHSKRVYSLAFPPNDETVVSCSMDQTIKIWDSDSTGSVGCLSTLTGHKDWVLSVYVASASRDKTVKIWDLEDAENPRCIHTFSGHHDWVTTIYPSADGQVVVSGSDDNTIIAWRIIVDEDEGGDDA
ncbi:U3 snoRNP protein [Penicillium manginii]|uniref:U3 snoRNP protein n=1 Tax=Penicillium manginii TaxID=203109 RepID=UPI00254827A7|nr:U3 snoRNP protein [Penicillium manginii]KAJ5768198.1 U3 snoRNP protein [Penicillium manginii]